ncbi:unnamed protein product [Eruca vesicaria subsp. sativa]|uniref:At2g35280-like TPR domain-containing protein n=1 Tax=Eruca vesicaria subsp. sativa TaxID=29727 RepID=A0ABC8JFK6_ERUVS|nr:unnamed protein product [Eruca vesicaria subsp. sativa]
MLSSPTLAEAAADPQVYKNINLHILTVYPLIPLCSYKELMDRCLAAGNFQAHYIRGIQEYFHNNDIGVGFPHLKIAAEVENKRSKNDAGFTGMERQHETRQHLLEKHQKITPWSKSHNPRRYYERLHRSKGTYHMSRRRDATSL